MKFSMTRQEKDDPLIQVWLYIVLTVFCGSVLLIILILCIVYVWFCLSLSGVLCDQCFLCLWIIHLWLPNQFSLTFVVYTRSDAYSKGCCCAIRRVWRYQRGNQNPHIKEEETTQWPKEKNAKGQTTIYKTYT